MSAWQITRRRSRAYLRGWPPMRGISGEEIACGQVGHVAYCEGRHDRVAGQLWERASGQDREGHPVTPRVQTPSSNRCVLIGRVDGIYAIVETADFIARGTINGAFASIVGSYAFMGRRV